MQHIPYMHFIFFPSRISYTTNKRRTTTTRVAYQRVNYGDQDIQRNNLTLIKLTMRYIVIYLYGMQPNFYQYFAVPLHSCICSIYIGVTQLTSFIVLVGRIFLTFSRNQKSWSSQAVMNPTHWE